MYGEDNSDEDKPLLPEVRVFWFIFGTFIVIGIISAFLSGMSDRWMYIQTVVLALTLLVISIYTFLTREMQQAMVKQTNVSILPVIEIEIYLEGGTVPYGRGALIAVREPFLELENIGNGTALNVTIDDIQIKDSMSTDWGIMGGDPVWFMPLSSLAPKEKQRIQDIQLIDIQRAKISRQGRPDTLKHLHPAIARSDYELVVRFSDILGNKYAQIYTLGKSGASIGVIKKSEEVRKTIINHKYIKSDIE